MTSLVLKKNVIGIIFKGVSVGFIIKFDKRATPDAMSTDRVNVGMEILIT